MNRNINSQEKISVIFLSGLLGAVMSKRGDFRLLWVFFWVCVKYFGRKTHKLNLTKTLLVGLELLTQFLEIIWFLVLRIKQKYQNKDKAQKRTDLQPNRVKKHSKFRKNFHENMKNIMQQHQAAVNDKFMNKKVQGQKGPKLTTKKSKKGIKTKTKSPKVVNNQTKTEIFWSDCEFDLITCIGCKRSFETNKIARTWIEANLCAECNNDESNPIFEMWCFACKKNQLTNTISNDVPNLCQDCDPSIKKQQDYVEYITYKEAEYFCECSHCLNGNIQYCQKEMCTQCTSPKPRVYGNKTKYHH